MAYSPGGKPTRLTLPDGTALDYTYSAHGELQSVSIPGEGSISVNQYKWTEPSKTTLPGGVTQNRSLDGLLQLQDLQVNTPGQQTLLQVTNTWGKVQDLQAQSRTDTASSTGSTPVSSTTSRNFAYDDEVRLTRVQTTAPSSDTQTYTLDALGNRIAHSRVSGAWTYDANNRLTQRGSGAGATSYQYDNAGNLTQKLEAGATTTYRYDTQNRLIEVALAQSVGIEQVIARYGYDPQDRRIWKEQYASKTGEPLFMAQRTLYLYSDQGLLAEAAQTFRSADASIITAPTITTQYGLRPGSPWGTAPLFIQTKNSAGQTSMAYYHHDQLGTPLQATDKEGNIVWAASFDAFGRASITTPQATIDKPTIASNLRLPGQYEDLETGLHYNWHRYYDAEVGRYVTSDPIGLEGGINFYSYVGGNPLSYTDAEGLKGVRPLQRGGNAYNRRQWERHGTNKFDTPKGEGSSSSWEAGAEMFTPDPGEGDYKLQCLRWECSENICTSGKSPTDFLPPDRFQDDAPDGCKCVQSTTGPIFHPPSADTTDVVDVLGKVRRFKNKRRLF